MSANKLLMLLVGAVLGTAAIPSWAATQAQIDAARNKGLWWLATHQNGEGRWGNSPIASVASTATALEALNASGLRGPLYARGYSWLANAPANSVDSLARQITAVGMSGGDTTRLTTGLMSARNVLFGWGSYERYETSYPDTALALIALLPNTTYTTTSAQNAVCRILEGKRADGGWSYTKAVFPGAANSSVIPTVYNMLAIDAAKTARGLAGTYACNSNSITASLASGMTWLLAQKKADNGFGAGSTSSVIETAFAYRALKQLSPADPATGTALDYLLAQQNAANGGWGDDAFLTSLVTSLLPPPLTPLVDTDKDGLPDAVEVLAGTNPAVADSSWLASGNGQSVAGLTIPIVLAKEAIINKPFSFTFSTPTGGTAPYTWSITSGSLPPGIALNATTGVLSGTPTALGSYPFYYSATDATAAQATTIGLIDVYQSEPSLATGDINNDGMVNAADVALVERIVLGLMTPTQAQKQQADVAPFGYPDGIIDAGDVAWIRRKALGLENW